MNTALITVRFVYSVLLLFTVARINLFCREEYISSHVETNKVRHVI